MDNVASLKSLKKMHLFCIPNRAAFILAVNNFVLLLN